MMGYARFIDHTLLKADATQAEIKLLCEEAETYQFASVCVNPTWVRDCAEELQSSHVKICTVVGFPLGATTTKAKVAETKQALLDGATEIDMVLAIGQLKSRNVSYVERDIEQVVQAVGEQGIVKVILETSLLTDEEKILACQLSKEAGAHFVKTSTGFGTAGATIPDVCLMRATVGEKMGVKASGGIRDQETTKAMIGAGATRIGASAGIAIVTEKAGTEVY